MTPKRALVLSRRAVFVICALGLVYLYQRFDALTLPERGCSPLLRYAPGTTLVLDRWAARRGTIEVGDALLYRAPDGALHLGRLERRDGADPTRLWLLTDDPNCDSQSSLDFGFIPLDECAARVIMPWPW